MIKLYTGESRGQTRYYEPGTSICLNCPLPEYYLSSNGLMYETCEQSAWHKNRKEEPKCLIAQANYYNIPLYEAEQIAEAVGLHHTRRITAWRYTEALKERGCDNGTDNHFRTIAQNGRAADPRRERPNGKTAV